MSAESMNAVPVTGRIFITGGTGFVGSNLLKALGNRPVRVLVRDKAKCGLTPSSTMELVQGDVTKPETLRGAMDGCEAVVHLVAIIAEEGKRTFDLLIRQATVNVVEEAKRAGIKRFLHMSAMGTRNDPHYGYFEAKWQAEQAVINSGIPWTIYRPSVIFGPGDEFINTLATLVKYAPVIPVVGTGQSKFQPVNVREVALCFLRGLDDPATAGHIYDIGGGKTYTYRELLQAIANQLEVKKPMVKVPVGLMKPVVKLSSPLPKALRPPVTSEQLKMLSIDNCSDNSATSFLLGRPPMRLEDGIGYISA